MILGRNWVNGMHPPSRTFNFSAWIRILAERLHSSYGVGAASIWRLGFHWDKANPNFSHRNLKRVEPEWRKAIFRYNMMTHHGTVTGSGVPKIAGLTESGFLHALDILQIVISDSRENPKWQEQSCRTWDANQRSMFISSEAHGRFVQFLFSFCRLSCACHSTIYK